MKRITAACFVLCCGWLLSADPADKEKLAAIMERVRQIEAKLDEIKQQKSSLLNEIYKIELQQETAVVQINRTNLLMADTQEKIKQKNTERAELEKKIARSRENLTIMLRVLYKMGAAGAVKIFVHVSSIDQLFRNYRLITALINLKMGEVKQIKTDIQKLETLKNELLQEAEHYSQLIAEKERKLTKLRSLKQDKLQVIEKTNRDRAAHMNLLDELKHEAEALNKIFVSGELKEGDPAIDFNKLKGTLNWPIAGQVISPFGRMKSARFNTFTINNGIEIRPVQTDEIRAVYGGEIVFSEYFRGYGNLLIIQHSRNFHTLYGHCESFVKQKGERVQQGEVIARVGNSGSLLGTSLYFEVRGNLKPEDPLKWLQKK